MDFKNIPQLKINIKAQSSDVAEIDIDGEIGWVNEAGDWNTAPMIKSKLREIANLDTRKIIVNINSLGGFVDDGLAIHDVLASHEAEIETRVTGMTASAATVIAQAGDTRVMSDNALYLIHQAWGMSVGNSQDMLAMAGDLEAIDERLLNIYAKRSGKDADEIKALMQENGGGGKWINSDEAKDFGLIDNVFEPMKAAASIPRSYFSKFGYPEPQDSKGNISDEEERTEEKPKAEEMKEEHQEESQQLANQGLRLWMRKIENRKQANKLIEVNQ